MALAFTNSNADLVDFGLGSHLSDLATGTFMAWIYRTVAGGATDRMVYCKGRPNQNRAKYLKINSTDNAQGAGSMQLGIYRATTPLVVEATGTPVRLHDWSFIAASYDLSLASTDQHLYVGYLDVPVAEVASYIQRQVGSGGQNVDNADAAVVGNAPDAVAAILSFAGSIAFVAVWNRQLSLQEIKEQQFNPRPTSGCVLFSHLFRHASGTGTMADSSGYASTGNVVGATTSSNLGHYFHIPLPVLRYPLSCIVDNPVALYRFDEPRGQPQDSSGNANHTNATYGTPLYGKPGPNLNPGIFLDSANAGSFSAPDHASLDLGDVFTLEAFVSRAGSLGNSMAIITKGATAYHLFMDNDPLGFGVAAAGGVTFAKSTVLINQLNTWYHLVATKNGSTVKLYLNGVDVTGTVTDATAINTTTDLFLGRWYAGGESVHGTIADIALYSTALSAERVREHYRSILLSTAGLPRALTGRGV